MIRLMPKRWSRAKRVDGILFVLLLTLLCCAVPVLAQPTQPSTSESRFSRAPEQEITFQQGLLYYSRGQLPQAETTFKQVIAADPNDAEAYYHLGLSQLDQGKAAEALASFDQAIKLDPTAREVHGARASANIRLGKYDAAEEDLKVLEPDPTWTSFVHYMRGQLYYAKGDLDAAAKEFNLAKQSGGTEAVPAGFYEGLTYLRMRELVRARSTFRESSLDVDRDPTVAAASRQLDAVLAAQQRRNKPWEVQLTLAAEYDSNAVLLGSNIQAPADISGQDDFRYLVQPRGSYSFFRKDRWDVGVEGSGYFSWYQELDQFETQSLQAGPYLNYRVAPELFFSARYGYNTMYVGHDDFLDRQLITPQVTYIEKDFGYTSAYYQFQDRSFDEVTTAATNRDSTNHGVGIVQGITFSSWLTQEGKTTLEVGYRLERQIADGSDYDAYLNTVSATLYAPLPFLKMRADAGLSLSYDNYDNPNSLNLVSPGDAREDYEWLVSVGVTRDLFQGCALRVDYSYTDHNSNVQSAPGSKPFEFDRHQVGVRVIFSY